jgi:hypothetical protein
MRTHLTLAVAAFAGLMIVAASTAHDSGAPAVPPPELGLQAAPVRIPDPVPLPVSHPAPKIVVDLK